MRTFWRRPHGLLLIILAIAVVTWGVSIWGVTGPGHAPGILAEAPPGVAIPITFQQGVAPVGYSGTKDTHINQWLGYRDTNYCTNSTIEVRTGDQRAALISFDISQVDRAAEIVSAEVQLYLEWSTNPGLTAPVGAYRVNREWEACQATWSRSNASTYWQMGGANGVATDRAGAPASTVVVGPEETWYAWDITDLVQEWVSQPSTNHGLILKSFWQDYSLAFGFASAGHGGAQFRPKLHIVYTVPTPTPTRTRTVTPTPTSSGTPTPSPTRTETPSLTPSPTETPSPTATWSPTATGTFSPSPTPTTTWTPTASSTPTPTLTSTPTPSATPILTGLLVGSVDLQGRPFPPSLSWRVGLEVVLYQNGAEVRRAQVTTDTSGGFSVVGVPLGLYDLTVKNPGTLRNRRNGVRVVSGVAAVHMGTLLAGDTNNDNKIDIVDFSLFRGLYGGSDPGSDFNGDGSVDILDFSLLRTNFGQEGDIILTHQGR